MVVRTKQPCQLELDLPTWGGKREGAGRKLQAARSTPSHRERARVRSWAPQLVTLRVREGVPNLRGAGAWAVVVRVMRAFRGRFGVAVVHYSVLANHLHLVVEAYDREILACGMKALCVRLARALNAHFGREGSLFASRYHARELSTPREVHHALRYVLLNARHHGELLADVLDRRSTAALFDGWAIPVETPHGQADYGTSPARSWLLRVGWRQHGRIDPHDVPGLPRPRMQRIGSAARRGLAPEVDSRTAS